MNKRNVKIIALRIFSVLLALFSVIFGITWNENGFCIGDHILAGMGLPTWSRGTEGTHYAAVIALIMLLAAFFLFSVTTAEKTRPFRRIITGTVVLILLINFLIPILPLI